MEQHIAAAQAVRRMLSRENNPPNQEAIDAGLIPALIRYLPSQNDTLAFETCWALTNIASGTSEQTRAVVDAGAIPLFVELLASPSVNVFEQAIWALGNIAGDSAELRDIVLAADALTFFISTLTQKTSASLPGVMPLGSSATSLVASPALTFTLCPQWALSSLSDGPNDRIAAVCEAGVIPRLIQLLSLNAPRVLTPALRCLGNIVTGDDTMTQVVVDAGFVPHLVKLVDHPKRSIQKEACWSLSNITAGTVNQIEVVVRSGALPLLVRQAIDGLFEVAKEACWALANLCEGGTAAQIQVALEANMLLAFDRMLQGQDTRIIVVAMQGIMASARKLDGAFYGFLDASLTLSLLEALQEHENPEVYRAAIAALELLDQNQGSDQED
ncbi:uncharacterized protein MONBRDRAFT_21605 [Monosiga brevicollis MX1]|uniref:Importin subunit alpha n=1 Tax=Monosiga brevicollis TaxID=81824 RepID=A9V4W2_MONBE|nr:uncharacterized protein MONBRDRAFT_21605 [Monosiga brevicollis MX1]EDQ87439.1 predicted protein [Monosiga brevicollis MX1]|eukprot:XP_001747699.1 hypothetical protein [Monosiga brevicollis MX1]